MAQSGLPESGSIAAEEPKFGSRESIVEIPHSTADTGKSKGSSSKSEMKPADEGPSQVNQDSEIEMADDESVQRLTNDNVTVIQPSSDSNQGASAHRKSGGQLGTGIVGYKAIDKLKHRVYDVVSHKKNKRVLLTKIQATMEAVAEVEPFLNCGVNDPDDVHIWLAKASGVLQDSNGILEGRSNMTDKKRLCSTCFDPTPFWETGELLRNAEKILEDKLKLYLTSYSSGLFYCNKLQSKEDMLQEILKALMDNDTDLIGLAGMIGVGKTVLARELARRTQENQLFDNTVMVQVSESVDVKSMQAQISKRIGLKLSEDDDEETSARRLSTALEQRTRRKVDRESVEQSRIVVIIDGLQQVIDLEKVGVTVKSRQKRRVVLVSRNPEICKKMNAEKIFHVECLDLDESKVLFGECLEGKMQSKEITRGKYEYLENVMVLKCGGLPLIISSLACVLRPMSWYNWEILADKLLKHSLVEIDEVKEVASAILELCNSFTRKGEEHKRFLLCCLILGQNGAGISLEKLKRYGIGFGLFANDSFTPFDEWVQELRTSSLLLETRPQDVKINDFVHNVGVSALAQGENNLPIILDAGASSHTRESFENCVAISMFSDTISESIDGLMLNKLQAFWLTNKGEDMTHSSIPDNFFQGMKNLKILQIYGRRIITVPSSIQPLQNLVVLHLEDCEIEGETRSTICKLDKLQVLSLRGSTIQVLPKEIGMLTNLRVLDMTSCKQLTIFPVDVVAKMVRLQELYLDDESSAWRDNDIKKLSSTTDGMSYDPSNFANLRRFRICVGCKYRELEDISGHSRALLIRNYSVPDLAKSSMRDLFVQSEYLQIDGLEGPTKSIGEFYKDVFSQLKSLHIVECYMESISEESRADMFPQLKEVKLEKLEILAPYALPAQVAVKLRTMKVSRCTRLSYIFPIDMNDDTDGADSCLEFPNMEVLELIDLPSLQALVQPSDDSMKSDKRPFLFDVKVKLPSLRTMWLDGLLLIESLWDPSGSLQMSQACGRISPHFGNLTSIIIYRCRNLKSLFSSPTYSLFHLETLRVVECETMRDIITSSASCSRDAEDDPNHVAVIAFPRLRALELVKLINLRCFYQGPFSLNFPMLKDLKLRDLEEMKAFTLPVLEGQQAILEHSSEETRPPFICSDQVTLSSIEMMTLNHVGRMTSLWDLPSGSRNLAGHELQQISQSCVKSPLFRNLKDLTISFCSHLESLFPNRVVNSLSQLETLQVVCCYSMKEVISGSTTDVEDDAITTTMITFPRLRVLRLNGMNRLECFYRRHSLSQAFQLPSLKELRLSDLQKMKAFTLPTTRSVEMEGPLFFDGEMDLSSLEVLNMFSMSNEYLFQNIADKLLLSLKNLVLWSTNLKIIGWNMLPNLQTLIISGLERWTSLMSSNLLAGGGVLTRLEYMRVENCRSLETIISGEELGEGEDQDFVKYGITLFPSLKKIEFFNLRRLESFSRGSFEAHFPSLEIFEIWGCDSWTSFSKGGLTTPMLKSVKLNGRPGFDEFNSILARAQLAEREEMRKRYSSRDSYTNNSNEGSMSFQKLMKVSIPPSSEWLLKEMKESSSTSSPSLQKNMKESSTLPIIQRTADMFK